MTCRACAPTDGRRPPRSCRECGAVFRGERITDLRPPFDLLGRYRSLILVAAAVLTLITIWRFSRGGINDALPYVQLLVFAGFIVAGHAVLLRSPIHVYEHGLERDIPRSGNKSVYLPWDAIDHYEIAGRTLRYTWRPDGRVVLRDGRDRARWPYLYFPNTLTLPDDRTAEQIRGFLGRAVARVGAVD